MQILSGASLSPNTYSLFNSYSKLMILPFSGSLKYLGRLVNLEFWDAVELNNRIALAWKKFMVFKTEFMNKSYSLNDRLRLFQSTVTATALYGAATWTLTREMELKLLRTQRRMLRMILGQGRRRQLHDDDSIEPWVDWVIRTTREVEQRLIKLNIEDWICTYRRRKWNWAGQVARMAETRLAHVAAAWDAGLHAMCLRLQGRPRQRWSDSLNSLLRKHGQVSD